VWWLLFAFLCTLMVVIGFETALHFLGPAIDGPFQLYNSLRRIAAGQTGGVDFQFFHGLAIPYLHYPFYRLLGGSFLASEITRELVSVVLYPLVVFAFLRFFIRGWTRLAAWCAIVMAASIALRMTSLLVAVNSLLGVRSAVPTLIPVVLCLGVSRNARRALAGVAIGLALALGTEQGLAIVAALIVSTVVVAWRSGDRVAYVVDAMVEVAIGVVVLLAVLFVIGGAAGMRQALDYNFRLVPLDQYWYFGAPPNLFLGSWGSLPKMLPTIPRIPLTILAGMVTVWIFLRRTVRAANPAEERERFAFSVLALYGLISCASLLGTYVHAYVQPLLRVLLLLGAVHLDRFFPVRDQRLGRTPLLGVSRSIVHTSVATLLIMIAVVPSVFVTVFVTIPHVVRAHVIRREGGVYAGIWPKTIIGGRAIVDAHRHADGSLPTMWSTYAGLLEAHYGTFQPGFDYIIHALGPANRATYVEDFRRDRPELVQTVKPTYTQYEPWIESTSWDFYAELLQHYALIGGTPWSFFWQRQAVAAPPPQEVWSAQVPADANAIDLPAPPGNDGVVLLQAELTYRVRNPLHVLPVIGATPRYLIHIENAAHMTAVTLDPYVQVSRIPILAYRGRAPRLVWNAFSLLPGARIDVTQVRLSFVPVEGANTQWLQDLFLRQTGQAPDQ